MIPVNILHYRIQFLILTENWIQTQLLNDDQFYSYILCEHEINNYNSIYTKNVHTLQKKLSLKLIWPRRFRPYIERFVRRNLYYFEYAKVIRKNKIDIIHAHFGKEGSYIVDLAKKLRIPLVTSFYGYDLNVLNKSRYFKNQFSKLFKWGSLFLVEGNYSAKNLERLGCPKEKIKVLHLGIDLEKFYFRERKRKKNEKLKIMMSCGFREKKGIPYALEAVTICLRLGLKIKVDLIGDGALKNDIQRIIDNNDLNNIVNLYGYRPHEFLIKKYYQNHIFLSPSITASNGDTEGGAPVTLIEAQATGMPVISSLHCDIPEVVINHKTGLLAEEKDVDTIVRHIEFFYNNSKLLDRFGYNARKHIESNYSKEILQNCLKNFYLSFK